MTYIANQDPQSGVPADQGDYRLNWIRDAVMELYLTSQAEHHQRYCEDWLYYYKHWKNWVDPRVSPDDYKSNIGVGIAYPIVEIVFAHLQEPWLSGDHVIEAEADTPEGEDAANAVGPWINRKITRAEDAYQQFAQVKRAALICGRGVLKPYIRYERPRSVLQRIASKVAGVRLGSSAHFQQQPPEKRMAYRSVDPFDWWKTPGCGNDYEWTFERYYLTTSQVAAKQESGEWDKLAVDIDDSDALGFDEMRMRRLNLESYWQNSVASGMTGERPLHRVVEFQGRLLVSDSDMSAPRYEDVKVVLLNENHIAKEDPLKSPGARPEYITWEPNQDPMSDRPVGLIEPIEDILLELNDYENIGLDNARKLVESSLLVDPNAFKGEKLRLGPGEINFVKNPKNSVVPLEMKDLPPSFYNQIGFLNDLIQRISGVSDYFGGMNTGDTSRLSKTATGMQLMANLASTRFGPLIASLDRDFYRKVAEWTVRTGQLWMDRPETFRGGQNPDNPFVTVQPGDLDAEMNFSFRTRALDPKTEERRQNFIRLVEQIQTMAEGMAAQGTHYVDYFELTRLLFDEFDREQETSRVIKQIPQMQQPAMGMGGAPMMPGMPPGMPPGMGPPPPQAPPEAA